MFQCSHQGFVVRKHGEGPPFQNKSNVAYTFHACE
jgi:hypothetical protein